MQQVGDSSGGIIPLYLLKEKIRQSASLLGGSPAMYLLFSTVHSFQCTLESLHLPEHFFSCLRNRKRLSHDLFFSPLVMWIPSAVIKRQQTWAYALWWIDERRPTFPHACWGKKVCQSYNIYSVSSVFLVLMVFPLGENSYIETISMSPISWISYAAHRLELKAQANKMALQHLLKISTGRHAPHLLRKPIPQSGIYNGKGMGCG